MLGKVRKIDKKAIESISALTPMQEGILFHYLNNPESDLYFEQLSLMITGKMDIHIFQKAWNIVIETNELLRTVFRWDQIDRPVQIVLKKFVCDIQFNEIEINNVNRGEIVEQYQKKDRKNKFDLFEVPFRVTLSKLENEHYLLLISYHHILFDGWSTGIILKEFFKVYNDLYHRKRSIQPSKNKFENYIKWLQQQDNIEHEIYWKEYLHNFTSQTSLPGKKKKIQIENQISNIQVKFSNSFTQLIRKFVKDQNTTLATLFYCAWGILLQKYSNTDDVVFGMTVSGRKPAIPQIEEMVGLFINTIPVRIKTNSEMTTSDLLSDTNHSLQKREDFECTSLVDIKKYSEIDAADNLFDSIIVIENYPLDQLLRDKNNPLQIESYSMFEATNFDLTLSIAAFDAIEVSFIYDNGLFNDSMIRRMATHFEHIVSEMIDHPDKKIDDIEILLSSEWELILHTFNCTKMDYQKDLTIHQRFENQVEKAPDQVALIFADRQITYQELNEKANQLARVLKDKGVQKEAFVGFMVERSIEMIIGILAILKSGGTYLPIDPDYPLERIRYMLSDSKASLLLTEEKLIKDLPIQYDCTVLNILDEALFCEDKNNLDLLVSPDNLAYMIYTSGSTGKPKGVMIEHRNVNNFISGISEKIEFTSEKTILALTTISFDIFVLETLLPLTKGLKVVLASREEKNDPEAIKGLIFDKNIDMLQVTPSRLKLLLESGDELNWLQKVKELMIGGEALPENLLKRVKDNFAGKIYNLYGPTEATVWSTIKDLTDEADVTIGSPIANTQIYMLNQWNQPQPLGVAGELCIGGDGVARGYYNQSDLTKARFIPNPFRTGEMIYRTGDLACWHADGNIEFLGRIDHQVKIRGFRIELGEIESQLQKMEEINEVVVIDRGDHAGEKYLCAYMVLKSEISAEKIRGSLKTELPDYMIPSYFVELEKIPLTPNGKINRRALPKPEISLKSSYVAPRNDVEEKLVKIWAEVLDFDQNRISIDADFLELGGHSLKSIRLISKIHKELNVKIPISQVFTLSTIRNFSKYILESNQDQFIAIQVAEEKEYYPVSSAQKRLYILQQMEKDQISYNMSSVIELEGKLDQVRLEESFRKLIARHENLQTSFHLINGEPMQKINEQIDFQIEYHESDLIANSVQDFVRPFDLSKAPLFRVGLMKQDENHHMLMIDMHHIISDGVSIGITQKDFMALYEGETLPPLPIQYKDYTEWQLAEKESEEIKEQGEYWIKEFKDEADQSVIPVLNLPTDYLRPSVHSFSGAVLSFEIGSTETGALKEMAKKEDATLYMILLSIFNVFLFKLSGQEDIVVGTPVAGRGHADLQNIIGMFVNTIPSRNRPNGKSRFVEFLRGVVKRTIHGIERQDYQFEDLVEKLVVNRDVSKNPLFDVMFTLQNMDHSPVEISGLKLKQGVFENKIAKFDLSLYGEERENTLFLTFEYSTKLFKEETIQRFVNYFKQLVSSVIENPEDQLSELNIIPEDEKNIILYKFNDTKKDYPTNRTFTELFEMQVAETPDHLAVVYQDQKLTYRELDQKTNQVARLLREKGIGPDTIVGMIIDPSIEMIIGMLGIMKAGGAYLPIAPENPDERIKYILDDSKVHVFLTQSDLLNRLEQLEYHSEIIDLFNDDLYSSHNTRLENSAGANNLAYVMYTSGSTGKPKGVMIEHQSLINLCYWHNTYHSVTSKDRVAKYAGFGFDASIMEVFPYLIKGAAIYVLESKIKLDIYQLNQYFAENQITIGFIPTQLCEQFIHLENHSLRILITGGDKLKDFTENRYDLVDYYGPTENTVVTTAFTVDQKSSNIPIGRPVFNSKVFILDKYNQLQPIGVPGELCVSGDGLARGYLHRPDLTEEKFVQNPIQKFSPERMYRTGDLARWLPDGNIEFLGRIDHQVKIRGCRIELGEIENQIKEIDYINEVVVLAREDGAREKYLCAYLVSDQEFDKTELRYVLAKSLPDFMIPSYFVTLDTMPLNSSGKVDRKALPAPEIRSEEEYVAPRNDLELRLAKIWMTVLGIDNDGIHDNFFDLGGHSLKAVNLIAKISQEFEVEFPLKELFNRPTIEGIASYIKEASRSEHISIEPIAKQDYYQVSSGQRRLFIINQMDGANTVYNLPGTMLVEGELDLQRFQDAFKKMINRHESLRTSLKLRDGEPVQIVHDQVEFEVDYTIAPENEEKDLIKKFIQPFDLKKAPLLRVELIQLATQKHLMLFDMHHTISDGVSMQNLVREVMDLYRGNELPDLRVQYKDFCAWQKKYFETDVFKKQEEYWVNLYQDEIPVLKMPLDYPRPLKRSFAGERVEYMIDEELSSQLNLLAKEKETTLFMLLLAAYNIVLSKYARQEDIIVGMPIAGRRHADLDQIIGMFVNTLAMRNQPSAQKTFSEFLTEVKINALNAYENQDYPFEELVWKLGIQRDVSRNPLFDAMIVSREKDIADQLGNLKLSPYEFEHNNAHFDLLLEVTESNNRIGLVLEFASQIYKKSTGENLVERYVKILDQIVENPDIKLEEINIYQDLLTAQSNLLIDDDGDFGF